MQNIEMQLLLMQKVYLKNLPAQIADLERLNNLFINENNSALVYGEICRKLHNLTGSSGIWNLKDISQKSRETLNFLESLNPSNQQVSQSALEKLRSHIIALKSLTLRYSGTRYPEQAQTPEQDCVLPMPGINILIATDDYSIRDKLTFDLSANEHQLTFVENGQQALEKSINNEFQLIILEINLPILEGYQIAQQLRNITRDEYVPILFLTASDKEQDLVRCIEYGGDDVICKPYRPSAINAKIYSLYRLAKLINSH